MPDLFSKDTNDTRYSLFYGRREAALFNDYNTELLEIVAQQNLIYWAIEGDETDVDDLYGEAERKVSRNPVKFYAWILLDEPEITSGVFGSNRKRRLEVYAHKDRLTEVGLFPKVGDYLEWDNEFFEIHYCDVPVFVHGFQESKIGVTMRGVTVAEGVFSPRKNWGNDPTADHDSQNPYT